MQECHSSRLLNLGELIWKVRQINPIQLVLGEKLRGNKRKLQIIAKIGAVFKKIQEINGERIIFNNHPQRINGRIAMNLEAQIIIKEIIMTEDMVVIESLEIIEDLEMTENSEIIEDMEVEEKGAVEEEEGIAVETVMIIKMVIVNKEEIDLEEVEAEEVEGKAIDHKIMIEVKIDNKVIEGQISIRENNLIIHLVQKEDGEAHKLIQTKP